MAGRITMAPRGDFNIDSTSTWLMGIKFDNLSSITYLTELDIPEYQEFEGTLSYDWWKITCSDGKTLSSYAPKSAVSTYNPKTSGSGSVKTSYFEPQLMNFGYTKEEVTRMSWNTAREIKDLRVASSEVAILIDGTWKYLKSVTTGGAQQPLLIEDKTSDNGFKVLAYPLFVRNVKSLLGIERSISLTTFFVGIAERKSQAF